LSAARAVAKLQAQACGVQHDVYARPEDRGVLRKNDCLAGVTDRPVQQMAPLSDRSGVQLSDRWHVDDLAFDELDAIIGTENAGLGHAEIVFDRKTVPSRHVRGLGDHHSKL
jgi:hypothetical protein